MLAMVPTATASVTSATPKKILRSTANMRTTGGRMKFESRNSFLLKRTAETITGVPAT